jgi:hypothetical protein
MIELGNQTRDYAGDQKVIEALAKESNTSVDRVRELFEAEHAKLTAEARVKTYISVIATRLVRNALANDQKSKTN